MSQLDLFGNPKVKEEIKLDDRIFYPVEDLEIFKENILLKLDSAISEVNYYKDKTCNIELSKNERLALIERCEKYVISLEKALERIENKTYGICRSTGKFISKERLLAVPTATISLKSIE